MNSILKLLFIPLIAVLFYPNLCFAKNYTIDAINIKAEILEDGSASIEENRSYTFRGSFRWADYNLPLRGIKQVTNFSLKEGDFVYEQSDSQLPGTYQVQYNENSFYVKWYYRATNENRTFTLSYRVKGAVRVYRDVAEFYYKFVGADSPRMINVVTVDLKLPQFADTSEVRSWAHGPLEGNLNFENGNINARVNPLPRGAFWEVRVIFPLEWVPSATQIIDQYQKDIIFAEEKQWVEKSNILRERAIEKAALREEREQKAKQYSIILSLVGLFVLVALYQRYGRSFPVQYHENISSQVPEDFSPAVANYVFNAGTLNASSLVSTLFDLARRGFLKLEETKEAQKFLFVSYQKTTYTLILDRNVYDKNKGNLKSFERDLVDFIFNDLAAGENKILFNELSKARTRFLKWFNSWKKLIKEEWGNRPLFDKLSVKGTVVSAIVSLLIVAAGVFLMLNWGTPGIFAIIAGVIVFGFSFSILRYTKEVKSIRTKLTAFIKYLTKYHFRRETHVIEANFEKYLIYGIALGMGSKVIKELITTLPNWQSASYMPWYAGAISHSSATSFANAVSSIVTVASSTMGSASGTGGGASAGGGGGAGGAAGGAG